MKTSLRMLFHFFAAACLGACSGEGQVADELSTDEAELFPAGSTLWSPASGSNLTVLNVCWENPTAAGGSVTTRRWAQDAVNNTWGAVAWIDFTWSTTCAGNEQIRIRLEDSGPHTQGLGTRHGKVFLNHAFTRWGTTCTRSTAALQNCIETNAVHEFGHALGLAHEQNRRDLACPNGPEQGTSGDFPMGRPDPDSIMSYCPGGEWTRPLLSALDALHIQRLYGGWDAPVVHGATYALRPQAGWFYRLGNPPGLSGPGTLATSSTRLQETDGSRNMMLVEKRSGTGRVHYEEEVSLRDQRTGLYYCPSTLTQIGTPACGQCQPPITVIEVTAGSTSPCYWTPRWTPSSVGGSEIHVNDPFVLWSGTRSFSGSSTASLRFLGEFFPPQ